MNFEEDTVSGRLARPLRRIKKSETDYERLQRPEGIAPGESIPSVEGYVLILSNLPESVTSVDIRNLFSSVDSDTDGFGNVKSIKLPLDDFGNCSGWALVELDSRIGFERAIEKLNGSSYFLPDGHTETTAGEQTMSPQHGGPSESSTTTSRDGDEGKPLLMVQPAFIAEDDTDLTELQRTQAEEEEGAGMLKRGREDERKSAVDNSYEEDKPAEKKRKDE